MNQNQPQGVLDPEEYRLERLRGGLLESDGDLRRRTGGEGDLEGETLLVRGLPRSLCLEAFALTGEGEDVRRRRGGDREREGESDCDAEEL